MRYRDIILARALGKGKRGMAVGWPLMLGIAGGGGGTETTITGVSPLLLEMAMHKPLKSLTQYGLCSQSGTPTPASSVPIMCNNGALQMLNLANMNADNIVVGKYINNNGNETSAPSNFYYSPLIPVKASTAYTLKTSRSLNYSNFMEYDANKGFLQRTLYGSADTPAGAVTTHTTRADTAYIRFGSNINGQTLTANAVLAIEWMFTEGATPMDYVPNGQLSVVGTPEVISVGGKNLNGGTIDHKGYTSTGGESTSTTFAGTLFKIPCAEGQKFTVSWDGFPDGLNGVFVNTWKTDGTWNTRQAISASTSLTYTIGAGVGIVNFTLYKTGGITIGDNAWIQVEYGDTATGYQPYVTPQTASAVNLFAVGDYADTQDIISGAIARKVGVYVITGAENIGVSNTCFTIPISDRMTSKTALLCSHFPYSSKTSSQTEDETIISFSSTNIGFRYDACADKTAFAAWLKGQYDAGTPVIVIYPLATETTESVTPQALRTNAGDNTISVTANVSPIELEAVYMKGA